jgi:hypothetical protein
MRSEIRLSVFFNTLLSGRETEKQEEFDED